MVGNMNCVDQCCVVRQITYKDNVRVGTGLVGKLQVGSSRILGNAVAWDKECRLKLEWYFFCFLGKVLKSLAFQEKKNISVLTILLGGLKRIRILQTSPSFIYVRYFSNIYRTELYKSK